VINELLSSPEPSKAWVEEFNTAALSIENRDEFDEGVPSSAHVLSWYAFLSGKRLYIASPPIVINSGAARLVLDVMEPLVGNSRNHVNVHAIPCSTDGTLLDKVAPHNVACIVTAPGATASMIFAVWDFVAREGVEMSIKSGIVTKSWLTVITGKVPCEELASEEENHYIKMLSVYANEVDLDKALATYMKLYIGANSSMAKRMISTYNKLYFYLLVNVGVLLGEDDDDRTRGRLAVLYEDEINGMKYKLATAKGKALARWLLNGVELSHSYYKSILSRADTLIYGAGGQRTRRLIRSDDEYSRYIVTKNTILPGLGFPPRVIDNIGWYDHDGSGWYNTHVMGAHPLTMSDVTGKSRTNRRGAIIGALGKLGRYTPYARDVTKRYRIENVYQIMRYLGKGRGIGITCEEMIIYDQETGKLITIEYTVG
jgi:hypothetical protein